MTAQVSENGEKHVFCGKTKQQQQKKHYECSFPFMAFTQASGPERTTLTLSQTENNKTFHGWFTKHTDQALAVKPLKSRADCKLPFVHLGSITLCKTKQMHKMILDIPFEGIKQLRCPAPSTKDYINTMQCQVPFLSLSPEKKSMTIQYYSKHYRGLSYSVFFSHYSLIWVLLQTKSSENEKLIFVQVLLLYEVPQKSMLFKFYISSFPQVNTCDCKNERYSIWATFCKQDFLLVKLLSAEN